MVTIRWATADIGHHRQPPALGERLMVGLDAVFGAHTIAISLPELHCLR